MVVRSAVPITMANILVTGGEGYVGSVLCPQLVEAGHSVISYDIGWFRLSDTPIFFREDGDIRDNAHFAGICRIHKIDIVINLACVSNDASFELDPELSKSINFDCFEDLVMSAKNAGVKRFISASTSSVYGVSDAINITEEHPLVPLTLYNEYKAKTEPLLLKHIDNDFQGIIIRPATICGYSPRMRLDLTVNILTNHAITNKEIKVFGGDQTRPNLHIQDMCNLYQMLVKLPEEKFPNGEIFNCGQCNYPIRDLANIVYYTLRDKINGIKITTTESDDKRSYHVDSSKIKNQLGFMPQYNVSYAVEDLYTKFKGGFIPNSMEDDNYYNVRQFKKLGVR